MTKTELLKAFKDNKIRIDDDERLEEIRIDSIGGEFDFLMLTDDENHWFDLTLNFNYFHGQLIAIDILKLTYNNSDGDTVDFSMDLQVDIAFDSWIFKNYTL